jgi:alpha-glucoside transport system substrate-binding protein
MGGRPPGDGELASGRRDLSKPIDWIGSALVSLVVAAGWGQLSTLWSSWAWAVWLPAVILGLTGGVCALLVRRRRRRGQRVTAGGGLVTAAGTGLVLALVATVTLVVVDRGQVDDCERRPSEDVVEVMVIWTGDELEAFCDVTAAYAPGVEVTSVGQDIGRALEDRFDADDPPDAAIVAQPSLLKRYAAEGSLCPIVDDVVELFPDDWNELVRSRSRGSGPEQEYGAFVKGAHKSMFWYRGDVLGDHAATRAGRAEQPETWSWHEMTGWFTGHVGDESIGAPLTLAGEEQWPLTDWFENHLASIDPDLYEAMADGLVRDWDRPEVRRPLTDALTALAELWNTPGLFAGGPERIQQTSLEEVAPQLDDGEAAVMFAPSFLAGPIEELPGDVRLYPFGFPALTGSRSGEGVRPLVVGGDVAMVPAPSEGCGRATLAVDLVRWLTGRDATELWSEQDPGFLTPNDNTPHRIDGETAPDNEDLVREYLTYQLRHPPADGLHFDLSDDQFAAANQDDPRGTWQMFAAYFGDVTRGRVARDEAVDCAIARLEAEYRGNAWPPTRCDE